MQRVGGQKFSLIRRVEAGEGPLDDSDEDLLNSGDFKFNYEFGLRVSLIRQGIFWGNDLELNYFGIDGWKSTVEWILPVLIRQEPGEEGIRFDYGSRLYSTEINLRRPVTENMALLAGFRWVEIHEDFDGTLFGDMGEYQEELWIGNLNTDNHLYGFQIGFEGSLYNRGGPLRIDGVLKAGIYGNCADFSLRSLDTEIDYSDRRGHVAFLGELGLMGVYQVSDHLALRAGYQVMWIEGVALALDQFNHLDYMEQDWRLFTGGSLFYHGAIAGAEFKF